MGRIVGRLLGVNEGIVLGKYVGIVDEDGIEGANDGVVVGLVVGLVGSFDGRYVGRREGVNVGVIEGPGFGLFVGPRDDDNVLVNRADMTYSIFLAPWYLQGVYAPDTSASFILEKTYNDPP